MSLPLASRAFLWAFGPLCLLLGSSFYLVSTLVRQQVRHGLRDSLEQVQRTLDRTRSAHELRNSRLLAIVAENPSLKAGIELWRSTPGTSVEVRQTLNEQLAEIAQVIDCDFLLLQAGESEAAIAGVARHGQKPIEPINLTAIGKNTGSLTIYRGDLFSTTEVPVNLDNEHVGTLTIGRTFDLEYFTGQTALLQNGRVLRTNLPGAVPNVLEKGLAGCRPNAECDIVVANESYVVTRVESREFSGGFEIVQFQSVDAASAPLQLVLRQVFLFAAVLALAGAAAVSYFSSRALAKPLVRLVARLRRSEEQGRLAEDFRTDSAISEVDELARALNQAARAIADSRGRLEHAYTSFIDSLAASLDARDVYTAGHSQRVSRYSIEIAKAMNLPREFQEQLRIGALLHDIGKIGIPDAVLQKPAPLSDEEFLNIQRHPVIGRRILEGIEGFEIYLSIVELHHENHDGSGYPHALCGADIPLDARIVHVADAYDAMTSDRPYRKGLTHEEAMQRICKGEGRQFDPAITRCLAEMSVNGWRGEPLPTMRNGILSLHDQVSAE